MEAQRGLLFHPTKMPLKWCHKSIQIRMESILVLILDVPGHLEEDLIYVRIIRLLILGKGSLDARNVQEGLLERLILIGIVA